LRKARFIALAMGRFFMGNANRRRLHVAAVAIFRRWASTRRLTVAATGFDIQHIFVSGSSGQGQSKQISQKSEPSFPIPPLPISHFESSLSRFTKL